ncbi:TadE/TadG family type IV pilus assembly protein [Consotaella salsifontis]|uniref:TadE-like protein n=1 Tax=Consotaella salsifontis TaxID=1365950 RepID=A0A1T4MFA8_9HYPH|nr:TadE/TadG family type IV pilus assembly protein [Consotaella salsifontis]SJZ65603.1 TadE-like protein [Consotaella salsifontis]
MSVRSRIKGVGRDRGGAAALEFALVAPIFFALVFSIFEAGWLMTQSMMLDQAVEGTVRLLRLGKLGNPSQKSVKKGDMRRSPDPS